MRFFLLLFVVPNVCLATINDFSNVTYHVKPYLEVPGFDLNLNAESAQQVDLAPNTRVNTGIQFTYKNLIGVGVGFKNSLESATRETRGKTEYQDWRFRYSYERLYAQASFLEYTGLYIENSPSLDSSIGSGDSMIQLPDASFRSIGANVYWIQDDDFSIQAALDQSERQESSGGAWVLGFAYNKLEIKNNGPLIPAIVREDFGEDKNVEKVNFQSLTVAGGYGYTLAITKKIFISGLLMFGLGAREGQYFLENETRGGVASASKANLFLSTGFNGDDYFWGYSVYGNGTNYLLSSLEINYVIWGQQLYFGMRF